MKHWDNHSQSQQTPLECGCVSAIDSNGRTIWIADAHGIDGKHFVVRAEEKWRLFWSSNLRFALAVHKIKLLMGQRFA